MPAIAAHEYSPWDFWSEASPEERDAQLALQQTVVAGRADHELGEQCFLSELASIDNDSLRLGDRTYVAAGAYLTGDLRAYDEFLAERWNLFDHPDPDIDKPSPLPDHLRWLTEAGYVGVDAFWLRAGHAVFGGYRPLAGEV